MNRTPKKGLCNCEEQVAQDVHDAVLSTGSHGSGRSPNRRHYTCIKAPCDAIAKRGPSPLDRIRKEKFFKASTRAIKALGDSRSSNLITTKQSPSLYDLPEVCEKIACPQKLRKSSVGEYPVVASAEGATPSPVDDKVLISFDSEWCLQDAETNLILSYQVGVLANGKCCTQIIYPEEGQRLSLEHIVAAALHAAQSVRGMLPEIPREVYLIAHWTTADMRALADFAQRKKDFDGLRRSYVTLKEPFCVTIRSADATEKKVSVHMRDSMLFAPAGKQSLEALGEVIGIPKVELPEGSKKNMDAFLAENPDLYEEYARMDVVIPLLWVKLCMEKLRRFIEPHGHLPITLGGIAEKACRAILEETGTDSITLVGKELQKREIFKYGKYRTITEIVTKELVHVNYTLACEAYHGGRNETYLYGATTVGDWRDIDLASAYPAALASLHSPDWDQMRITTAPSDFKPSEIGIALLDFEFPRNVRFPCLPVRTEKGLSFPRKGHSYCTSAEISLALRLGAKVTIKVGVVVPSVAGRPFESVFKVLTILRKKEPKGSLGNLLYKEMANSIYGKLGQGLKRKRVFDTRTADRVDLPPGALTNPYIAAHTTGLVRAVLGEILNGLPPHVEVLSATTDGLLSVATEEHIKFATAGPICTLFSQVRGNLTGEEAQSPVEEKHRAKQLLGVRRRGQATLIPEKNSACVLAKAGLKPPSRVPEEQNAWFVKMFQERDYKSKFSYEHLPALYEMYITERDLIAYPVERRLNMDYDFCRKPVSLRTREVSGVPLVAFDTVPWETADEGVRASKEWAAFAATRQVAMRDEDVLREFMDRLSITTRPRAKRAPPLKLAIRYFLRAYRHSMWGLIPEFSSKRNLELAKWLDQAGYKVTVREVENAGKHDAKLEEHWVPRTPETLNFVEVIKARWPNFRDDLLLELLKT